MAQKTLVHMRTDRHPQAIITTVLDVKPDRGYLVVDAGNDDNFNQRLVTAATIHFEARVDKIRIQFSTGQALGQVFEDRRAFRLPLPEVLRRLQRRDNFRIETLVSMPLFCEVVATEGRTQTLQVKDISVGGVALRDPEKVLSDVPGSCCRNAASSWAATLAQ